MSSTKRKADASSEKRPTKRPKPEKAVRSKVVPEKIASRDKLSSSSTEKPQSKSVLVKEQAAFPRGGASLLTPLEKKQINAQAWRDAQKEDGGASGLFDDDGSDSDQPLDEGHMLTGTFKNKAKKSKGRKTKDGPQQPRDTQIGGLSYKRLSTGTLVLGQVVAITDRDVSIALPNGLVGFLPINAISQKLNEKIQKLLVDIEEQSDDEHDEDEGVDLLSYFKIGQFLHAQVTATASDPSNANSSSRRRLELTTDPDIINADLSTQTLVPGSMLQVYVQSVEDHGLIVNLGLAGSNSTGFIPSNNLASEMSLPQIKEGAVILCQVTKASSSSKVIQLSANLDIPIIIKTAPTVDVFLPGTLTEILITEVQDTGLVGKVMGMLTATADLVHSGAYLSKDSFTENYKVGTKIQGRILYRYPDSDGSKLGFTIRDHLLDLRKSTVAGRTAIGNVVSQATVITVEPGLGLYLDLGNHSTGFAHISRLADGRVDSIGSTIGKYKIGSQHPSRIIDYNATDDMYTVSLQESIIKQPFLRLEDVPIGQVVRGVIDKVIIGPAGIKGLIVKFAETMTGFVPDIHLSDVVLQNPEKKFREGATVKARVLSTDLSKRQVRLTLKKTLVNSEAKVWNTFSEIAVGDSSVGTLVKVDQKGALVQFYSNVKGFLPVAEMSEAFIKDAREHFRPGQTVTVNTLSVDPEHGKLTVSCRDRKAAIASPETSLSSIKAGTLVNGEVFGKSENDLMLRLESSDAIARLSVDHVSEGSTKKRHSALSKIRVGQKLTDLLVLDVQPKRRMVILCNRPSLLKAAQTGKLLTGFDKLDIGTTVTGFISNVTADGIYVAFALRISALIPRSNIPTEQESQPDFGHKKFQTITATISAVDYKGATPRFWLSLKQSINDHVPVKSDSNNDTAPLVGAVDSSIKVMADLTVNRVIKARIVSVKESQLNVELAKDVQGRIDVSEIFDRWEEIKDRKQPLLAFSTRQVIDVKIIGAHDTRNHRFLPLSHRTSKTSVFELTMKPSSLADPSFSPLDYSAIQVGQDFIAFVNNIGNDYVWASLSPSVRGRVKAVDLSDDLALAAEIPTNFPVGSAVRVKVVAVDPEKSRLDLTGRLSASKTGLTLKDVSAGQILPGRVTKVSERQVLVSLSDTVVGAIDLVDMADDYSEANPAKFRKHEIIRVCVVQVDVANKKVRLSVRPSKILSSRLPVSDPEVNSLDQLELNDVCRGFICNVDNKGIFITLGHGVTAFVRVAHLSDDFLKEWKDSFQRDQLVEGKIINIDRATNHVQMSLKNSVMSKDYVPPIELSDLQPGDVVTGKVAKVEEFGVFVLVDNSVNVRGLCHRSEIAEKRIEDARKLFNEGDVVTAKVLKVELEKRRISFGLKASYFADDGVSSESAASDGESNGEDVDMDSASNSGADNLVATSDAGMSDDDSEGGAELVAVRDRMDITKEDDAFDASDEDTLQQPPVSLNVGGFDWHGMSAKTTTRRDDLTDVEELTQSKKRKKRAEIPVDRTGDLDTHGPQSADDFERLLLGEPDSSLLWLRYMAFHLNLGDIDAGRQLGERALKSIGIGQVEEKQNIWIALLNLEVEYGDDDSLDAMFKRACEYNDPQEMHTKLASILISTQKYSKADELFQTMLKKYTQDPKTWINYASFLFDQKNDAEAGRALLSRALQILPKFTHVEVTSKFAQLEFKSDAGLPERGRTIFEGLVSAFPKRIDLYNVLLDLEMKVGDADQIRALYERIFSRRLKPKQAQYFFKRWLAYEEEKGDQRKVEEVKAKAATWVRREVGQE
jgi:rRNA biogenesis protein RRP5